MSDIAKVVPAANEAAVFVSVFASITATRAALAERMTWPQAVEALLVAPRVYNLDELTPKSPGAPDFKKPSNLRLVSFAEFREGIRSRANVVGVHALGFDFDGDGATVEAALAAFPGVLGLIHPTFNDRPEKRALRIFLVASRPMTASEYDRCWAVGQKRLGASQGDEARDPSRWFYVPAQIEGRPAPEMTELVGLPFDVDAWLAEAGPVPAPAPTPEPVSDGTMGVLFSSSKRASSYEREAAHKLLAESWPDTGRNDAQLALAGCLLRVGYADDEAVDALRVVSGDAPDSTDWTKRAATVRATRAKLVAKVSVTGWDQVAPALKPEGQKRAGRIFDMLRGGLFECLEGKAPPENDTTATGVKDEKKGPIFSFGGWRESPPPKVYLVDRYIAKGSVNSFFGKGGHMKTWAALDLGLAVAKGVPWLGKFATTKGKVGYLDFESDREEIHGRVHQLAGQDADCFDYVQGHAVGGHLHNEKFWNALDAEGLDLLIIDSLRAGSSGIDENSDKASDPMGYAAKFAVRTGATVIFIHHAGKTEGSDERGQLVHP